MSTEVVIGLMSVALAVLVPAVAWTVTTIQRTREELVKLQAEQAAFKEAVRETLKRIEQSR